MRRDLGSRITAAISRKDEKFIVMAGVVPVIHVLMIRRKTWMPGIKPGMTKMEC
jgi:hypothetical protein